MAFLDRTGESVSTGVPGLDYVLDGGFAYNHTHLLEGRPGSGKTTLALQFLIEGRNRGEECLFVTISETAEELRRIAASYDFSLDGIDLFELVSPEQTQSQRNEQSIIYSSELELGETIQQVMDRVTSGKPRRIAFGSFSEIRLLAQEALRYRRQILALEHFFSRQVCTVLLLDNLVQQEDLNLESLAHCVMRLEQLPLPYGAQRRRLRVEKMRGRAFQSGYHDFVIGRGGLKVFPRLVSAEHPTVDVELTPSPCGIAAVDEMLGGGLDRGATTLIRGPSGVGKSALALQIAIASAERGDASLFISFEETRRNFIRRADSLKIPVKDSLAGGSLVFLRVDPAQLSPGEFADIIRNAVAAGTRTIVLDSVTGYQTAMPTENELLLHLHELLTFLNEQGVVSVLVLVQGAADTLFGPPLFVTYLADTVLQLRFFEAGDEIKRGISVGKKRIGRHESGIRELSFDECGMRVGAKLHGFTNQLSSHPEYRGHDIFMSPRPLP